MSSCPCLLLCGSLLKLAVATELHRLWVRSSQSHWEGCKQEEVSSATAPPLINSAVREAASSYNGRPINTPEIEAHTGAGTGGGAQCLRNTKTQESLPREGREGLQHPSPLLLLAP